MVSQGPIPAVAHGLYEYLLGIALIALPLLLGYDSGAATAVSIVLGVFVLFLAAASDSKTSLVNQIPLPAHVLIDYLLVAALIGSPFLFGFSDESAPTAVFLIAGVLQLLVSIGTRYKKEEAVGPPAEPPRRERPSSGRGAMRDDEIPEFEPPPRP